MARPKQPVSIAKLATSPQLGGKRPATAADLQRRRPDTLEACKVLLAANMTESSIAAVLRMDKRTVKAVREQAGMASGKERLAGTMHTAAQRLTDHVLCVMDDPERAARVSVKDAAFSAAQLAERAQSLTGNATQSIEVTINDPGRDELAAALLKIRMGQHADGKTDFAATVDATMRHRPSLTLDAHFASSSTVNP